MNVQRDALQSLAGEASRSSLGRIHDAVGVGMPVTVTSITLFGVGLQDWVYILTLVVASCQIVRYLAGGWLWWRRRRLHGAPAAEAGAE